MLVKRICTGYPVRVNARGWRAQGRPACLFFSFVVYTAHAHNLNTHTQTKHAHLRNPTANTIASSPTPRGTSRPHATLVKIHVAHDAVRPDPDASVQIGRFEGQDPSRNARVAERTLFTFAVDGKVRIGTAIVAARPMVNGAESLVIGPSGPRRHCGCARVRAGRQVHAARMRMALTRVASERAKLDHDCHKQTHAHTPIHTCSTLRDTLL